jgi:hypothetical protein
MMMSRLVDNNFCALSFNVICYILLRYHIAYKTNRFLPLKKTISTISNDISLKETMIFFARICLKR